jgi:vitamin B12 transporter
MVFLFAAALAVASTPTPSPLPSTSPLPEIAHVVTSDRGSESAARAARTTYVVTAADMARNGDHTIADAIENVPGVEINRYGAFGAQTSFGIRGSSSAQVLVLLDGLPIAGAQIQNVQLEALPVSGVDRVEVVEGGGSTLYGSGSIGGVINIISTQPKTTSADVSTGSFGEQSYQFSSPYISFQRTYATNDFSLPGGLTRQNANAGLTALRAAYEHSFGAIDLSFTGDVSSQGVRAPGSLDFSSATSFQGTNANDLRLKAEYRRPHSTFSVSLGDSTQNLSYNCNTPDDDSCPNTPYPPPPPGAPTPPPYSQYLYDTRVMVSANDSVGDGRQRIVYGIDLSRGVARIDGGTGDPAAVANAYAQSAAYVQQQWFGSNGSEIYAGLRGENDYTQNSNASGGALSPSIGAIVKIAPALSLKLNAATAFRAPDAEDLFYPYYSNPNLVPERTRVGDATLTDSSLFGGVSFGWFTTSGTNLIIFDDVSFIPENVGRASIQGFTLTGNTRSYHGLTGTLAITNLYRAQDLDTDPAVDPYSGGRLPGRGPVFATTLGAHYTAPGWSRFDGYGVKITSWGQQSPNANEPYYAQSAAFTTLNAYAGYRITPKAILTLRGNNLLGARYAYYNGYPMPGPSYTLELRSR